MSIQMIHSLYVASSELFDVPCVQGLSITMHEHRDAHTVLVLSAAAE